MGCTCECECGVRKCCEEDELKCKSFGFEHDTPVLFVNSQWRMPQWVYLVYRVIVAVVFITFLVMSWTVDYGWYTLSKHRFKWPVYLSNWMLFVLTTEVLVEMVVVAVALCMSKKGVVQESMPWYYKTVWCLYNIASNSAVVICIFYWTLIYPDQTGPIHYISIFKHAIAAGYVILNLFITGIPIRILHFWQPLILGVLYLIFSMVYDLLVGGTDTKGRPFIYSSLDWSDEPAKAAINSSMAMAAVLVVWILLYALYKIRMCLRSCCCGEMTSQSYTLANTVPETKVDV